MAEEEERRREIEEVDCKTNDTTDMTFCMTNYHKGVLKMMSMMRTHHMLTDVKLIVSSETFEAHKLMLAAASPYFKAMFTGGLKESQCSEVTLHGICPSIMNRLLSFIYTGQIHITELAVCQILPAASMLQITDVIKACCIFLERQLSPVNALGIASFAEQHGCLELHKKANEFIMQHFAEVCQEEEFVQLSTKQLIDLIRKDELNVREETEVYNAVLRWVKYNEEERRPKMHAVLSAVRCQFLTPSFLNEQMKNCEVIKQLPACREYLAQIFRELTLHKRVSVRERIPKTPRVIYVAGGYLRSSLDTLESFNLDTQKWTKLASLTIPRSGLGAAFVKGIFYAIGGRNNSPGCSYDSDWVDRYEPVRDSWRPCNPMSVPRNRVSVGVVDGMIYAVGGSAGVDYYNSVERYSPDEDVWYSVKSMTIKRLGFMLPILKASRSIAILQRKDHEWVKPEKGEAMEWCRFQIWPWDEIVNSSAVAVAVVDRLLYAMGGFDGQGRLSSCECYNPETNTWSLVPPMTTARSGGGVASWNQFIFVVGGFDGKRQLDSVERYDTVNKVWTSVAPLSVARSALSASVIDNKLYAIGGYDGQEFVATVEVYDPKTDFWVMGVPLTSPRSGHASAVSYHFPAFSPDGSS